MSKHRYIPEDETLAETHRRLGRVGLHYDDLPYGAKYPNVDFYKRDLEDDYEINEMNIRSSYSTYKKADVYKTFIPIDEIPDPQIVEEIEARDHVCDDSCEEDCFYACALSYDWVVNS